ncbi:hypothetical protein OPT61_g6756 [Boeremia exigua]|uniref:Uncharacterized protein n=1 Tax=Boeremia exigua TaxID=749465 RepID=A0ACC2I4X3_9PLEO|nr:hypothetical protein OPT61_g6756 [Boeremia exigua]
MELPGNAKSEYGQPPSAPNGENGGAVPAVQLTMEPPATMSLAPPTSLLSGRDRILCTYEQATETDRFALEEMTLLQDFEFRTHVNAHIRTNPSRPFRFLDLPTEIRIMVARYVLKGEGDEHLSFRWLIYSSDSRKATFTGLESLTALTRTCKQAHDELSSIVWDINTFNLNQQAMASSANSSD